MATQWAFTVAALTLGANAAAQTAERLPSIAVVAYNQAAVDSDTLARAKSEVTRIYREVGVSVTWMSPRAADPAGAFAIQLLLRRRPVIESGSVMGTAIGEAHEIGGLAFVFFERVLKSAHERQQDVACVLAYAMAHEMGHLLLPAPAHSPSGIMRSAWDGDDLRHIASGSLQFTQLQANAIRAKAVSCCPPTGAAASASVSVFQPTRPSNTSSLPVDEGSAADSSAAGASFQRL